MHGLALLGLALKPPRVQNFNNPKRANERADFVSEFVNTTRHLLVDDDDDKDNKKMSTQRPSIPFQSLISDTRPLGV